MDNNNYLSKLKILRSEYLQKAEEYYSKALDTEIDEEKDEYFSKSHECLGITEGLTKAIRLYNHLL